MIGVLLIRYSTIDAYFAFSTRFSVHVSMYVCLLYYNLNCW